MNPFSEMFISVCLWICAVVTAIQFVAMGFCTGVLMRLQRSRGTCPVCGGALTGNCKSRTAKLCSSIARTAAPICRDRCRAFTRR